MFDIATSGELLAEFIAVKRNQRFDETGDFRGPFPSGAPAIFASQAARMGANVAYAGCVGHDGFGDMILDRLRGDGIDVEAVQRDAQRPTGTAFVTYHDDGSRHFIYNIAHSAVGQQALSPERLKHLAASRFFHVMGSSLSSPEAIDIVRRLVGAVKANGGRISFDPNIRPELVASEPVKAAILNMLSECDIFLPSDADIDWLREQGETLEMTVQRLMAAHPMSLVVLKQAAQGCRAFSDNQTLTVAGLTVEEVDPTGAGDCFGGALVASLAQGKSLERSLELANAAGAHAVTCVGPMEGCSDLSQLEPRLASAGGGQ
ncbi:sugar kinase [Aidingimonas lacisalsi]|uniref:sugar kinase n=1 Tax=Aidingimonas lacisalsi TaxID=2604086 RepID=UPI0011D29C81|nr:sugar kinase [Aidingimonas lacisalsi]